MLKNKENTQNRTFLPKPQATHQWVIGGWGKLTNLVQGYRARRLVMGEAIAINRGRFDPVEFIRKGWSIITEETDIRSIALTELDLTKVRHVTMFKDGEICIHGYERLRRLKASNYIRLDADIFLTLLENQHLIPESWKERVNGNGRVICFDGTVLWLSGYRYCTLSLHWKRDSGQWGWTLRPLDTGRDDFEPSAVLAS